MSLKLYGVPKSTCTQRVLLAAAEVGIDVELVTIDFLKGEHKSPEYTKYQPFGSVPYLVDSTVSPPFVLYESRAIGRYLALKAGGKGLFPVHGEENYVQKLAIFEQAASVEVSNFDPFASGLAFELLFKKLTGKGETDPARVEVLAATFNAKLDAYEKILSKQPYMTGETYTLADLFHIPYGKTLFKIGRGEFITSRPHVDAWFKRITERETTKKVYADANGGH